MHVFINSRRYLGRWLAVLAILVFTSLTGLVCAQEGTHPSLKYQVWSVVARDDGTPLYASPSENAKVLRRFQKGHEMHFRTSPDAPSPWQGKEWVFYPVEGRQREGTNVPAGWLRRRDILVSSDFKKVTTWPIRYLIHDAEFYQVVYKFNPDGSGTGAHYNDEHPQGEHFGPLYVYMAQGIAAAGDASMPKELRTVPIILGIYDEHTQCIYGIYHRERNCERYRSRDFYPGDLAQVLFTEPLRPVYFGNLCVADCGEKKNYP